MNKHKFIQKFFSYVSLETDLDNFDKIHQSIQKDIVFKGTNLWILVFAILVASVGLNMNSTAVIIGAMLISPLMGPINGIGYSIATYDFPLFRQALKNFTFAVITSLITSTLYFIISPISTAHSELLARTSPSIYDVLIALFGGLAGIVAISSKQKGNVIPGVAIATALMPPLCTAGYGLATFQMTYFFGALYLFTINTVFIAIAALFVSQFLNFPIRTIIDSSQRKKVNSWISTIIAIVLIPSIYFGYQLVQKEKFNEQVTRFITNVSVYEGNYLLKHEVDASKQTVTLIYAGNTLTENQKQAIQTKAKDFSLQKAKVLFKQGLSFDDITQTDVEVTNLKSEIGRLSNVLKEKELQLDSIRNYSVIANSILQEIQIHYPSITHCTYTQSYDYTDSTGVAKKVHIVVFTSPKADKLRLEKMKFQTWLQARLQDKSVKAFFEKP
ncbi:MAG: hypothetical protein BWY22_00765 [Bacteroidetes bacterium ADurb.Bin217]|nr:MAG: hypothetical protein BWY22_00765 [Bacteroidetes bacterium ADurb.Bin217]